MHENFLVQFAGESVENSTTEEMLSIDAQHQSRETELKYLEGETDPHGTRCSYQLSYRHRLKLSPPICVDLKTDSLTVY